MDETKRNDAPKSPAPKSATTPGAGQGSGSDTVSAAKISAGTSVGNAGQPATPHASQSSLGSAGSHQTQGGSTGAERSGNPAQGVGGSAIGSAQAAADTARRTASLSRARRRARPASSCCRPPVKRCASAEKRRGQIPFPASPGTERCGSKPGCRSGNLWCQRNSQPWADHRASFRWWQPARTGSLRTGPGASHPGTWRFGARRQTHCTSR
jgi:hypothetical protein